MGAFAVEYEEIFLTIDLIARESVYEEYRIAVFAGLCQPTGRPLADFMDLQEQVWLGTGLGYRSSAPRRK